MVAAKTPDATPDQSPAARATANSTPVMTDRPTRSRRRSRCDQDRHAAGRQQDRHHHRRLQRQDPGSDDPGQCRGRSRAENAPSRSEDSPSRRGTAPSPTSRPTARAHQCVFAHRAAVPPDKSDAPRIAIVVAGLGISASGTADAFTKLPAPVTFAIAPYGADLARARRARRSGEARSAAAGADGAVRLSQQRLRPADAAYLADARPEYRPAALADEPLLRLCRHRRLHGRALYRLRSRRLRRCCARPPSAD